jgi:hypothetical protein
MAARKNAKAAIEPEKKEIIVLTAYDRLDDVWKLETANKQREMLGHLFSLAPDPGCLCIEALVLDNCFANFQFCQSSGFNKDQITALHKVLNDVMKLVRQVEPVVNLAECVAHFRAAMRTLSLTVVPAITITATNNDAGATQSLSSSNASRESKAKAGSEQKTSTRSVQNNSKASATEDKSSKTVDNTTIPVTVTETKLFTAEHLKLFTDYVANSVFAKYSLYQATFHPKLLACQTRLLAESPLLAVPLCDMNKLSQAAEKLITDERKATG